MDTDHSIDLSHHLRSYPEDWELELLGEIKEQFKSWREVARTLRKYGADYDQATWALISDGRQKTCRTWCRNALRMWANVNQDADYSMLPPTLMELADRENGIETQFLSLHPKAVIAVEGAAQLRKILGELRELGWDIELPTEDRVSALTGRDWTAVGRNIFNISVYRPLGLRLSKARQEKKLSWTTFVTQMFVSWSILAGEGALEDLVALLQQLDDHLPD